MIALVDMDGTLCDYAGTLSAELDKMMEAEKTSTCLPAQEEMSLEIRKRPGFWLNLPKIELGFKIVEILKEVGYDLHVLTKGPYRSTNAWTEKVEWCRKHLPGVPVTITENKGLVYGKILVDDWPEYCEAWLKWRPRGVVIMPAYPYNEGFDEKYPGQVIRVTMENVESIRKVLQTKMDG
jgi:5'(3')-deoxyribonucleotidase